MSDYFMHKLKGFEGQRTMRRYLITQLILLLACLIVTGSTFGQREDDRWQRIYSGDDATIEILPSSLRLESDHLLTVTFRTAMSSSQPLKKEKPGVKYKTVIETIEFNPITRQYRYSEIRWLDSGGTEVDHYQATAPTDWRPIKQAGMVDRMLEMAVSATPFGTWRVGYYRLAEGETKSSALRSEATKLIGTIVRLSPRKAEFGANLCNSPDYESRSLTADELGRQLGIQIRSIGIKSERVEVVNLKCLSDDWKPPQSLVIKLPEGGLLMLWNGIFFDLEKTDSSGTPLKRNAHAQNPTSRFVFGSG